MSVAGMYASRVTGSVSSYMLDVLFSVLVFEHVAFLLSSAFP